jgi:hypothetical protein
MRIAGERGVEAISPAAAQLREWLRVRPSDDLFEAAVEAIKIGLSVLPPAERAERVTRIVEACQEVAAASGGLSRMLGLGTGVSDDETSILDAIALTLRARPE